MKRIAIIYHNADMDGLMSGTFAKKFFDLLKEDARTATLFDYTLIGYNYGKDESVDTWLTNNQLYNIYMFIDITPPIEFLDKLITGQEVMILDHHKKAYQDITERVKFARYDNVHYFFNAEESGAKIFFREIKNISRLKKEKTFYSILLERSPFIHSEIIENIRVYFNHPRFINLINLVSSYDTWQWVDSKEYNALYLNESFYDLRSIEDYEPIVFDKRIDYLTVNDLLKIGRNSVDFKMNLAKSTKHILIKSEYKYIVFFAKNQYNIYFDTETIKEKYKQLEIEIDAICSFNINLLKSSVTVSSRSIKNDFNCYEFINTFAEGGGHKGAAGGIIELYEFQKYLIQNNINEQELIEFNNQLL